MQFVLYAHGGEIRLGEHGSVSRTDFFCVERKVHVARTTIWEYENVTSGETWHEPSLCDGSCRVWLAKELGIPSERRARIAALLKTPACLRPDCGKPAAWVRRTQFAGSHFYCDEHARQEKDFGTDDPSYFFWESAAPKPEEAS